MRKLFLLLFLLLLSVLAVSAQRSNQQLVNMIRNDKIKLTFESGSTKIMAVAENFPDSEAKAARVMAMNFAVGFFYPGQTLERTPNEMLLTFWVMSKKPVFAERHSLTLYADGAELQVGEARYSARARDNMEYLNFNVSREVLAKVASSSNVRFKLGEANFKFTGDQVRMFADLVRISDPFND